MAKLESIEHKIFASEAPLDEIGQFGSALDTTKLNTKDVTTIQALPAYTKGWGSAIISGNNYPTMEEMNGVLNVMSYHTGYLYQEGMPAWRSDREYSATSIVKEPTGTKFFHSLKDGNIGNTLDNTEYWEELKFGGSGLEVCDIGTALYIDETKGLRRYLNGQIVDINTNTQAFLNRLKEIQTTNPDYFTTEDNWQAEATLNIDGCVYKFVLNYSGDTVVSVRLPKYPDYVEINAGGTLPVVGNGMTLGMTNGATNFAFGNGSVTGSDGVVRQKIDGYGQPIGSSKETNYQVAGVYGVTSDPTKSGIQTTLKQTKLKMRYFIQIATGAETENNIINTLENVNGFTLLESKYSDKPLYNEGWLLSNGQYNAKAVYPTVYEGLQVEYNSEIEAGTTVTLPSGTKYTKRGLSVKLSTEDYTDYDFVLNTSDETFRLPLLDGSESIPSNKLVTLTHNGHNTSHIAPANGWFVIEGYGSTADLWLHNETSKISSSAEGNTDEASLTYTNIECKRGDIVSAGYYQGNVTGLWFTYAQGNGSLYYYIGETVQNANLINAGRIGEQLANKLDRNNKEEIVTWGMPDYSVGIEVTNLYTANTPYTAPSDGIIVTYQFAPGASIRFTINGVLTAYMLHSETQWAGSKSSITIPLSKGDVIRSSATSSTALRTCTFYPLKGAN